MVVLHPKATNPSYVKKRKASSHTSPPAKLPTKVTSPTSLYTVSAAECSSLSSPTVQPSDQPSDEIVCEHTADSVSVPAIEPKTDTPTKVPYSEKRARQKAFTSTGFSSNQLRRTRERLMASSQSEQEQPKMLVTCTGVFTLQCFLKDITMFICVQKVSSIIIWLSKYGKSHVKIV
ncbi:hypothetical protein P9112_005822 [Eukaryota sp. TZLM1-RC]